MIERGDKKMNDSKIYKVLCADTGMWVTVRTKQCVRNSKKMEEITGLKVKKFKPAPPFYKFLIFYKKVLTKSKNMIY